MTDLQFLGQRIRELRTRMKLSQEEFAHRCRLHRTYIGQLERGEKNVSFESLTKIALVLGVSLADLFAELEHRPGPTKRQPEATPRESEELRLLQIRKAVARLIHQQTAFSETVELLQKLTKE